MQFPKWSRAWHRKIALRYAVVVAAVLFGYFALFGVFQIYSQSQSELRRLYTQATDQANFLSAVIPESVYFRNFLNLETLMRQTSAGDAVVYAVVIDTDGRALTRYLDRTKPLVSQALSQGESTGILDVIKIIGADPQVQEVHSPVISEGLFLGEVRLGYTTASVEAELVRITREALIGALLATLLLSLATALLFRWQVQRPLMAVIEFSQTLSAGDMESRVIIPRQDEIGSLGAAVNHMADRLQATLEGLRAANQALQSSEERTRAILTTAAQGIITIDEQGIIESFNPAAAHIFGYAPDEVLGRNVNILMPEPHQSSHDDYLSTYLATGVKKVIGIGRETEGRRKDGSIFPISLSVSQLWVGEQRLFTGIISDITERKQAEQELRMMTVQNLLLAQAVNAATEGIVITDACQPDNPIVYTNPAFTHITGYSQDEVLGRNCRFLQGPESSNPALNEVRQAIIENRSTAVTLLNYRKDGQPFWNDLAISPVFSPEGTVTHFVGIQTDSSERRQVARTLQSVLDTIGEGIISADPTGSIVMVNPEVERIFGYKPDEMIGQSLAMLMPERYRDAHQAGMDRYLSTGIPHVLGKRMELEGQRKHGQIFPLEILISESRFADQHLFIASIRDITERKEYDRMRDDFVSTVSHELRTPLAAVMGWTETLLDEAPGPLTELQRRFLTISYESSIRLNKLIEEILTVSRVQRGTLRIDQERFHPSAVLAATRKMIEGLASRKEIKICYEQNLPEQSIAIGDPRRCEQVLENLISNAMKFSPAGSTVVVNSDRVEDQWRVQVIDQGIGIPEAEIPKLFERFYRATNASSAQIQGTGLGLYVCKAIVEGHGGQVHLSSREGEGTTVCFTIPLEH